MAHQRQYTLTASIDVALSLVSCVVPTQLSPCRLIAIHFDSTTPAPSGLALSAFVEIAFGGVAVIWSNYGPFVDDAGLTRVTMSQNLPAQSSVMPNQTDKGLQMALPIHLIIGSRHTVKFGLLAQDGLTTLVSNASVVVEPLDGAELEIYLTGLDDE